MAAFSDYFENAVLNWVKDVDMPVSPTTLYVSLHTTATTDAGGGTEVSGNGYARVAITGATGWSAISGGAITNAGAVTFPAATASWGTVTHFAIWDASTAGNMVVHGALTTAKSVGTSDVVSFAIGALSITVA